MFSPLIIGEVPSTVSAQAGACQVTIFSPLIIGEVPSRCREVGAASGAVHGTSVPSSSGRCLQRIVAQRSTPKHSVTEHENLQSPHHRGGAFNARRARQQSRSLLQSPHHRGGAFNGNVSDRDIALPSVPSSSGRCLQLQGTLRQDRVAQSSVPSSSGRCLQQRPLGAQQRRGFLRGV